MSTQVIQRVLDRLSNIRPSGNGMTARCPSHDDHNNSLSVSVGDDGRILLHCFAGCTIEKIVAALHLTLADLFQKGEGGVYIPAKSSASVQQFASPVGCTLAHYAKAKNLSIEFLRSIGLSDLYYLGQPAVRIPYRAEDGTERAVRFRIALDKSPTEDNRFRWKNGSKPCLYGLWRLKETRIASYVILVEGESDAQTLWSCGFPSLGIPGANNWKEDWAAVLADIPRIYVVIEPDTGGQAVRRWLDRSAIRDRAYLVSLPDAKDPSELYLRNPDAFPNAWRQALDTAIPWQSLTQAEADVRAMSAWERCQDLARFPRILDQLAAVLMQLGVAGEERLAKLLYLAVTSRLLDRPVSIVVKGPSSAGKSYLTEKVLKLFPPDAYYALSAMSERALAYSEEPLSHRMLVIYEAAGLSSDFATYLIRSLLSEGCVRYETVEKTRDGLRPRLIERDGPTGLIVTTTALNLHPENETRLISVPVNDSAAQTRLVLRALADDRPDPSPHLSEWHALQEWLASTDCRVFIPYARPLADKIPPLAVRLRRDFKTLLTLISSHALLHQANRSRAADGRIVASLDDYAVVRDLVADLFAEGLEATVSDTLRETVNATAQLVIKDKSETTVINIAQALQLDRSAASRRVQAAITRGYLKNLEDRKGRPARIIIGDPLPDEVHVLPYADILADSQEYCTVAPISPGISSSPSLPMCILATNNRADEWEVI